VISVRRSSTPLPLSERWLGTGEEEFESDEGAEEDTAGELLDEDAADEAVADEEEEEEEQEEEEQEVWLRGEEAGESERSSSAFMVRALQQR